MLHFACIQASVEGQTGEVTHMVAPCVNPTGFVVLFRETDALESMSSSVLPGLRDEKSNRSVIIAFSSKCHQAYMR